MATKDPFTHQLIGLAMATHRVVGPGLVEEAYHQHFVESLRQAGIEHHSKLRSDLVYRGYVADTFEADLVFPERLIVELKALRGDFDNEHFTQILSYNKFWRIRTGLLLDYGKPSLSPKRVIYTSRTSVVPQLKPPTFVTDPELASAVVQLARRCLADIGLGYRETTWIGLMSAALIAEGIPFVFKPSITLPHSGPTSLRCFVIDGRLAMTVTALGEGVTASDRAYLQTYLHWLNLPCGFTIHFGKANCDLRYVQAPNRTP